MEVVRCLRKIWFALAAFTWLSMTMHCQLESVPGLEFLACQTTNTGDSDSHCDTGCCAVEKSQYRTEQSRVSFPPPELLPMSLAPLLAAANSLPDEASAGVLTTAPPQLLKTWHFASRTALPVRAPSMAS